MKVSVLLSVPAISLAEQIRELLQLIAQIVSIAVAQFLAEGEDVVEEADGVVLLADRRPEEHLRHRHV